MNGGSWCQTYAQRICLLVDEAMGICASKYWMAGLAHHGEEDSLIFRAMFLEGVTAWPKEGFFRVLGSCSSPCPCQMASESVSCAVVRWIVQAYAHQATRMWWLYRRPRTLCLWSRSYPSLHYVHVHVLFYRHPGEVRIVGEVGEFFVWAETLP